jgi:uroporphyrinogen decarboxylase
VFVDHWGCKFTNVQRGVIGEIKEALIQGENFEDIDKLRIPVENLTIDIGKVNEFCANTDKFVLAGACPRPFERLQFLRKTDQLYVDLIVQSDGLKELIRRMHNYYCSLLEVWAKTDVDALMFMDDWGSQRGLLINPKLWVSIFKPIYKDFIDIAHTHGKKIFMHSDGHILAIYPHLIELGLDAVNSQLFCMGLENLKPFRGKITFWGEIDRQHLLPEGTLEDIENAVKSVKEALWSNGGCIAQCEFGAGAKPENVRKVYETWNAII